MPTPFKDRSDLITYITSSHPLTASVKYVEASVESILLNFSSSVAKTGGMDTRKIDPFRQGINVTNGNQFFKSRLFKISSTGFSHRDTDDLHRLSAREYGMPKLFDDIGPYYDVTSKFNAQSFISDTGTQTYPQSFFDPTLQFPDTMDGVIEPFSIREVISNRSIEAPFISRTIKASIMNGNKEGTDGTDRVVQYTERLLPIKVDPFIDGSSIVMLGIGLGLTGSNFFLNGPGISSDIPRTITPYRDSFTQYGTLYIFTGSTRESNLTSRFKKSATAGHMYRNTNGTGTDSMAFGGLQMKSTNSIRCDDES
jgi:hypothetical protein